MLRSAPPSLAFRIDIYSYRLTREVIGRITALSEQDDTVSGLVLGEDIVNRGWVAHGPTIGVRVFANNQLTTHS